MTAELPEETATTFVPERDYLRAYWRMMGMYLTLTDVSEHVKEECNDLDLLSRHSEDVALVAIPKRILEDVAALAALPLPRPPSP